MEAPGGYPAVARKLIKELGIETERFYKYFDQNLYSSFGLSRDYFLTRRPSAPTTWPSATLSTHRFSSIPPFRQMQGPTWRVCSKTSNTICTTSLSKSAARTSRTRTIVHT